MSLIRVLQTAPETLTHTFTVDEVPTDAAAGVTCTLKRLDGTTVTSGAATHPGPTGQYQFAVPGQAQLDTLTLDWAGTFGGGLVTMRDYIEVVGGFLFGLPEARAVKPPLSVTTWPTQVLAEKRVETEDECEGICGQAFVPRFARVAVQGRGRRELVLPSLKVRTVRAVTVGGVAWGAMDVSGITPTESGVLTRLFGSPWPAGQIIVEYEYGGDFVPPGIRTAAMLRFRHRLTLSDTTVPYQALSFRIADGGVYRLSSPSKDKTGIPEVDAAYARHTLDAGGFA